MRRRRLRMSTSDPSRPRGDLRTTNRQVSTDAAAMVDRRYRELKNYFFRAPVSVPLISLDHERTERYSSNCMSRLGVPRGIHAGGPRLRARIQKPPGAQTPFPNLPGPISNLQSASGPPLYAAVLCLASRRPHSTCSGRPRLATRNCENQRHVPPPAPRARLGCPRLRPRNIRSGTYATRARRAHTITPRSGGAACGLLGAPG